MTTKTTKTILFASLIAAMIIPVAAISAQGPQPVPYNAQAEIEQIEQFGIPLFEAKRELNEIKRTLEDPEKVSGVSSEQIEAAQERVLELEATIQTNKNALEELEQDRIQRFKIQPDLEAELRENQQKALDSDFPIIGTSLSHSQKALVLLVDENALTKEKNKGYYQKEIRSEFTGIPLVIKFGTNIEESCTSATANCDPIVGGIQMEAKNHGVCSIGLPVTRSGVDGWITAAHCVNTGSGSANDVYQPTEDWFGWNKVGDTTVRVYAEECDCAFVDQSSSDDTEESVWRSSNNYLPITGYVDRAANGSTVVLFGAEDNSIHFGTVDDNTATFTINNIDFDGVRLTSDISEGGDSGGAYTDGGGDDFLGIHKGVTGGDSFFIPWENIEDELGL